LVRGRNDNDGAAINEKGWQRSNKLSKRIACVKRKNEEKPKIGWHQ